MQAIEILIDRLAAEPAAAADGAAAPHEGASAAQEDCTAPATGEDAGSLILSRSRSEEGVPKDARIIAEKQGAGTSAEARQAAPYNDTGAARSKNGASCMPANRATDETAAQGPLDEANKHSEQMAVSCSARSVTGKGASAKKPARNRECPCGSRQRYKNCCGPAQAAAARKAAQPGLHDVDDVDDNAPGMAALYL